MDAITSFEMGQDFDPQQKITALTTGGNLYMTHTKKKSQKKEN